MTSVQPIDPNKPFADQLAASSPDLLRDMLASFIQSLMSAEADAVCGAGYGERTPERVTSRNGYRHRDFDTRVGTSMGRSRNCVQTATSRTGRSNAAHAPNAAP
jgi:putative transposase